MKKKLKDLMERYGRIAFFVYFSIFFSVWFAFYIAIWSGVDLKTLEDWVNSWSFWSAPLELKQSGTIVLAYAATKCTQPIRIAVTLSLTPIVAQFLGKKEKNGNNDEDKVSN